MAQAQPFSQPNVQGWGVDLDIKNRPAYPKERTPPRFIHPHWREVEQQPVRVKVFHSMERPSITPVFGTSMPPSGLSGKIREYAYKLSESDLRHWLLLLLADRVNVVEGLFQDLSRGYIPNIFAEMGIRSEFKYNRKGLYRKAVIAASVLGLFGIWMASRNRQSIEARSL